MTKDGCFRVATDISVTHTVSFTIGSKRLMGNDSVGTTGSLVLVEPGDSLHIEIPTPKSRISADVRFSGRGAEKQHLLKAINQDLGKAIATDVRTGAYVEKYVDRTIARWRIVEEHLRANEHSVSESALAVIRSKLAGSCHYSLVEYFKATLHEINARADYLNYLNFFPVEDLLASPEAAISEPTVLEGRAVINHCIVNGVPFDASISRDTKGMYGILKKTYGTSAVGSAVLACFIVRRARLAGWNAAVEEIVSDYVDVFPAADPFRKQVELIRTGFKANLTKGATAFEFALPDITGAVRTMSEFRGKVVLIDFMFNGCGGCANMVPKLSALERQFENHDVVFISISVDPTLEKFRDGIGKYCSPTSIALFTNGEAYDHPIIRHYGIRGYPTLVLIDKKGTIISGRAPNPRTDAGINELVQLIEDAL